MDSPDIERFYGGSQTVAGIFGKPAPDGGCCRSIAGISQSRKKGYSALSAIFDNRGDPVDAIGVRGDNMKGYFTVEAACIMPLMLSVYVFLIFVMFYRYDRCLLDQDVGLMAMQENAQLRGGRSMDRYPAFRWKERSIKDDLGRVTAYAEGTVRMPFAQVLQWTGTGSWDISASFAKWEVEPVEWIRLYRKVRKGAENATD